jgi:pyrimidine oxygenase
MKLGVFLPNGQNGYVVSNSSPQYVPTYQHMLDITKECERIGLDFILSMIKYRGFGGTSGYWESCLDSITLACGLAAHTSTIELYATVPVLGIHPAVAARQISTFNDISKGRAGVNIVTGWNRPEYQQMGLWPGDDYHDRRYEYTEEYIKIMRTLWARRPHDLRRGVLQAHGLHMLSDAEPGNPHRLRRAVAARTDLHRPARRI